MLNVIMLSVVLLNVFMLGVVMLNVMAPKMFIFRIKLMMPSLYQNSMFYTSFQLIIPN
jgi:hypothetical protein